MSATARRRLDGRQWVGGGMCRGLTRLMADQVWRLRITYPSSTTLTARRRIGGGFAVATCQWLTAVSSKVDVARASADRWRDAQTRVTSPPRTLEECRDCPRPGHQQRSLPLTVDHCILDINFIRYSVCCDPSPDCKRLRTMHIVARRSAFSSTSRLNSHTRPFSKVFGSVTGSTPITPVRETDP